MLTRILEKLGFQLTADVWEANERLKDKLSLAEKTSAAHEANANFNYQKYLRVAEKHSKVHRKYRDACLRIIELEGECNGYVEELSIVRDQLPVFPYPQKGD